MRIIEGENDLLLTCTRVSSGVAILRCETRDDAVRLPDEIDGAPVLQLGAYALSERAPDLAGRETFAAVSYTHLISCGPAMRSPPFYPAFLTQKLMRYIGCSRAGGSSLSASRSDAGVIAAKEMRVSGG